MNFQTSTHKRDWLFDADTLKRKYADAQQQAVQTLASQKGSDGTAPDAKRLRASVISLEDEAQLKLYYQVTLKEICQQQKLPSKVLNAALMFFKRFYTQASCLEHDPRRVMPTCIYLACKVEESYRSAEGLCKVFAMDQGLVLRFEVPLLQGLQFDLVVHSPYRALAGLFKEFDQLRAQQSAAVDPGLLSAPSESLAAAHSKARAAVDVLMLTDAPLLYTPGALAVAAMRSGFRTVNLSCQQYLKHVAHKAAAVTAAGGTAAAAEASSGSGAAAVVAEQRHQQLLAMLAAIDTLAAEQGHIDAALKDKAAGIDKAMKVWRKSLTAAAGGSSSTGQQ